MESWLWMRAPVGHTFAQGASSHCRHCTGVLTLEVFMSFKRGMKYAGASFDKASDAECPSTQATSHVRQPMHFPGSAITSLFIISPASPTVTSKSFIGVRVAIEIGNETSSARNRFRPRFPFEPIANHAGNRSRKSSASARTESATAGLIGSPNPICAGWIPSAKISAWPFSLM